MQGDQVAGGGSHAEFELFVAAQCRVRMSWTSVRQLVLASSMASLMPTSSAADGQLAGPAAPVGRSSASRWAATPERSTQSMLSRTWAVVITAGR